MEHRGRRGSTLTLSAALVAVCAVALAVWLLLERSPQAATPTLPAEGARGVSAEALVPGDLPAPELVSERTPLPPGPSAEEGAKAAPPEPQALGRITGIVSVDGAVPQDVRVLLRSSDGTCEREAELDRFGRFGFEGVPTVELTVSCAIPDPVPGSTEQRRLVSPHAEVVPKPGGREHLDFAWVTKHVNLRVISDDPAGNAARVEVEGPATSASFDTDDLGKAKLSLVGNGRFVFRAIQPSGRRGEAAVELAEDVDLETVVIAATLPQ